MAVFTTFAFLLTIEASYSTSFADGYVHLTEFKFPVNQPNFCSSKDTTVRPPYVIAYVHSSPQHFERRIMIRRTWANLAHYDQLGLKTFFVVGVPQNQSTWPRLQAEAQNYGDVVIADFIDSYANLTFKNLAGLRFVREYCKHVPFVLKVDDDTFVDSFQVIKLLRNSESSGGSFGALTPPATNPLKKTFFGRKAQKTAPYRNKFHKHYLSEKTYSEVFYPGKYSNTQILNSECNLQ